MVVDPALRETRRPPRPVGPARTPKSRLNPQVIAHEREQPYAARPTIVHLLVANDEESRPLGERLGRPGFRRDPITFIHKPSEMTDS
jgi:hypothetical protein